MFSPFIWNICVLHQTFAWYTDNYISWKYAWSKIYEMQLNLVRCKMFSYYRFHSVMSCTFQFVADYLNKDSKKNIFVQQTSVVILRCNKTAGACWKGLLFVSDTLHKRTLAVGKDNRPGVNRRHTSTNSTKYLNSLPPNDAYMRQLIVPSTVQIMACQCWNIVNWAIGNKLQWNLNWNVKCFHSRKCIWKCRLEMAVILSRPQCVKLQVRKRTVQIIRVTL